VAETVVVHEVGLRDGLQNQPRLVPLESKLAMLDALIEAGCRSIEATSFVSPKAVPQMADAAELYARLPRDAGINFEALVPNERGYDRAVECGVTTVALVLAATDTFNRKNINMSLDKAVAVNEAVIGRAKADGIRARSYISVATACPYEGPTPPEVVFDLTARMINAGADEVVISSQAQAAAVVAQALQATSTQSDIRLDKVEAAKAALERGDHKNPDVVATVAERLSKFL